MNAVFDNAKVLANLKLKAKQCVLVPLAAALNVEITAKIKQWLLEYIPSWSEFTIASHAKYLGFLLGPTANQSQWNSAAQKWKARSEAIAATGAGWRSMLSIVQHQGATSAWVPAPIIHAARVVVQSIETDGAARAASAYERLG